MAEAPDTIVLIHGLWMTPRSWEHWQARYEGRGYRVLAPAWPGLEGDVEALRRDPTPLTKLDIPTVVAHYERIIRELERPPIVMGHSLGGAFMQLLLDRGLGAAGVGVAAATVKGIYDLPRSTIVGPPGTQQPAQPRQGVTAERRAVPLRLREHAHPGGVGRDLRALLRARPRTACSSSSRSRTSIRARRRRSTSSGTTARRC